MFRYVYFICLFIFFFSLSFVIRLMCDKNRKKRLESVIYLDMFILFVYLFIFFLSFVIRVIKIGRNDTSL